MEESDFNKGKVSNKVAKVIPQIFSDVPPFTLVALDEKEILTEKIRALITRAQARDLYDLWMLLGKKVEIDKNLIYKKLKEEKVDLNRITLLSKESYETDLRNLVDYIPDYEQIKKEIIEFIEELK